MESSPAVDYTLYICRYYPTSSHIPCSLAIRVPDHLSRVVFQNMASVVRSPVKEEARP